MVRAKTILSSGFTIRKGEKTNNHPRTIWSVVNSQTFLVKEKFPSSATFLISNLKTRRMDLDRSAKLPEQKFPQKGRHYFVFSSCIKEITIGKVAFIQLKGCCLGGFSENSLVFLRNSSEYRCLIEYAPHFRRDWLSDRMFS